ncbi:radical SAM protein [Candidatus Woesebacteria bacterium]|nr:radical SAM protein [Candidatus Woesebacteria bacterium]QQG47449.1 MAG: radical SAM protein [Candidatus Woesebacteria bacterium]
MNEWIFRTFSPIIKVVGAGCNLRCTYCFYFGHQPKINIMGNDVLKLVLSECLQAASFVRFIWHGGEPTIAGAEYYRKILAIEDKVRRDGQKVTHSIQTNATLLNPQWIDLLKSKRFSIGVSIDGPEYLHNFARINANGRGSFREVQKGIVLFRNAGIKFGSIAVVNSYTVNFPEEIFWFMYNQKISFSANACVAYPSDPEEVRQLTISPMQFSNFLLRLLDLWLKTDDPTFNIKPLDDIIKGILGRQPSLCRYRGQCQMYLTIDSNGDVYPCDEYLNQNYNFGNLRQTPLKKIVQSTNLNEYYAGRTIMQTVCQNCQWFNICKGGCMREWGGSKSITDPRETEFCKARQFLFEEVRDRIQLLGYSKKEILNV